MRFELMITAMSRQYPNQLDYRPTQENKILESINSYKNYDYPTNEYNVVRKFWSRPSC